MRIGGPIFEKYENSEEWVHLVKSKGYSAAYCPLSPDAQENVVSEFKNAAEKANIVIAEVGAWSNPLSSDDKEKRHALEKCKKALYLAETIGARCCVNIAGSRGNKWDGPDEKNLTEETFEMIVETVREIIDSVKPRETYYTLETMPWVYPDSADSYLDLIKAIDRKHFAVHFDPANLICSVRRYYFNGDLIKEFVGKLGKFICSCHAKDVIMSEKPMVCIEETRPGLGNLDYRTYLTQINKLDRDVPLMMEHLHNENEYKLAADYIRSIAGEQKISFL